MDFAIVTVAAYLLGSIPFGLILTKMFGYGDIRKIGSGNIGTTNVLRTGNKSLAVLTLLCDAFKGAAAVCFSVLLLGDVLSDWGDVFILFVVPLAAVLGHMFPVWLGFKGGKGVATGIGVLAVLSPYTALATMVLWIPIAYITRLSSLATLLVSVLIPIGLWLFDRIEVIPLSIVLIILIFFKHKGNIGRLLKGTEPRIKI
ncbi:MAG: glycerol-3-phosphate 1-O-acyltransferase PlsY [Alphaproteobacteria bacterium]|nr:glycerol-3-phosphate 1-O-acyltransferase PlsY [Alphaproteobacteria bacterium]MCL2505090.1 glycerol-3-phosphate 1-O-acyltransferase PlsY [Alphaproteobacteria bacterium]